MSSSRVKRVWKNATFDQKKAFLAAYDKFRVKAEEFKLDMGGLADLIYNMWNMLCVGEKVKTLPPNLDCMLISIHDVSQYAEKAYDEMLENWGAGFADGIHEFSKLPERE